MVDMDAWLPSLIERVLALLLRSTSSSVRIWA
jgi:hypothetical protein